MTDKDLTKAIADRIKIARDQAGLSQGQVAKILDYHRPTISEIEAGRRKVSAEELGKFAKIFKVSMTWLSASEADASDADPQKAKIELAARELSKIKKDDLDKVLNLLASLRKQK